MKYKITWLSNGVSQIYVLVNHKCQIKDKYGFFTIYSPLYKAIEDGSFCLSTGYGKHQFKIEEQ
jgi:hypothetical protein